MRALETVLWSFYKTTAIIITTLQIGKDSPFGTEETPWMKRGKANGVGGGGGTLGDGGNEACGDVGGARRQREEPASVTWVVGCPGRCSPEKPVQQSGPQRNL